MGSSHSIPFDLISRLHILVPHKFVRSLLGGSSAAIVMQHSSGMLGSDQHSFAIAALAALGTDLVAMRGQTAKLHADFNMDSQTEARKPRGRSRTGSRRRNAGSLSSRSTARSSTKSSRSSSKSLTKGAQRKGKARSKAKSTTSKASNSKASSLGDGGRSKRVVVTVAPEPKSEKYVPPPRGTFRSSHTRYLRAEVLGTLISELEAATTIGSVPMLTDSTSTSERSHSSQSTQAQDVIKRPPLAAIARPQPKYTLADLPTLALSEFDFFSASRSRAGTVRDTSEMWSRSPAAPAPPRVRRWLKNARIEPVGIVTEVEEQERYES